MQSKVEKLYNRQIGKEELSFDSPFFTELLYTISEELKTYERTCYADKPDEIRRLEEAVRTGAMGKYSLGEEEQKILFRYNEDRMEKDPVFRMRSYSESLVDDIKYLRSVLSRQYEKLSSEQNGEALIDRVLNKKFNGEEIDPFWQLVTRNNALKEFLQEYSDHLVKLSADVEAGEKYRNVCLALLPDMDEVKKPLVCLYIKLFDFANEFYRLNHFALEDVGASDIMKEIDFNRDFIIKNQKSLNKLTRPQYVALEHSKLVAVTKKIMDSAAPVSSIRVDGKGTKVEASITTDEEHQGIHIDSFDTLVEEAIGCLLDTNRTTFEKNGYMDVPLSAIAQQVLILNPNAHISKDQGNSITESMEKLRHLFVKVDFRAQALAHKKLKIDVAQATIEDNALNYTKTTVNYKGNTIEVFRIHSYPPRYKYSKTVRQISGIPREYIYLPNMNITRGVAILRRYLVEYIEGIKNSNLSKTIFFDTINKACDGCFAYESKESKRDFRNKVTSILDGFRGNGYIEGYEVVKEGRFLKGVTIYVKNIGKLTEGK